MSDSQTLSREQWHHRYTDQAQWTRELREYLFKYLELSPEDKVLEVGSGTGAILEQLITEMDGKILGLDIDFSVLKFSKENNNRPDYAQADGHSLPLKGQYFSISLCHYLLLWVKNPIKVLTEMVRVTKSGGCVLALAEPDHLSRIDYPPPLEILGKLQTSALETQGADVAMGRQLRQMFYACGLINIEVGIIGAQWTKSQKVVTKETEWMILQLDLAGKISEQELKQYHHTDTVSRRNESRVLYIPTFYAIGFVP